LLLWLTCANFGMGSVRIWSGEERLTLPCRTICRKARSRHGFSCMYSIYKYDLYPSHTVLSLPSPLHCVDVACFKECRLIHHFSTTSSPSRLFSLITFSLLRSWKLSPSTKMKLSSFLLPLTCLANGATALSAAGWKGQSIYQVITDRFARTDGSTTAACNAANGVYCGGTWRGIINHLDYIQNMGFTAVSTICG
jgi:hypothetical protein